MAIELRPIRDDEYGAFREALYNGFGDDAEEVDPGGEVRTRALMPTGAIAAFDGDEIVGTAGTLELVIGVPGRTLRVAGLTSCSVRSTHRRRGILRSLIEMHLAEARRRGLGTSALWASEASIYGRFGYGVATQQDELSLANAASLLPPPARDDGHAITLVSEATARTLEPVLYARAIADRPGALHRSDTWWNVSRFRETPWVRQGASKLRHAIVWRGEEPRGYVAFRQKGAWADDLPAGTVRIVELVASDAAAEAALWRFITGIDLYPNVTWDHAPVDGPLPWLARDPRRVRRLRSDGMWLRIEDVPAALQARRYRSDGTVHLQVEGTTYELAIRGGEATCQPSERPAALAMSRATFGALYLGGTPASTLMRAGLIEALADGNMDTVGLTDRLFDTATAPWCPEVF